MPAPKTRPKQFSREYADIFKDQSVVDAYRFRPTYPPEVFQILNDLIDRSASPRAILDAGCGTGFVARELTGFADRVDAVDVSENMIRAGERFPGGDSPKINWICAAIEDAPLAPPYALITAGEALHWMEWHIAMARFAESLTPNGMLVIVEHVAVREDWMRDVFSAAGPYSMNRDFEQYDMITITEDLRSRSLFEPVGMRETGIVVTQQPVADVVESLHARNGFSRQRMSAKAQAECDQAVSEALYRAFPNGTVIQKGSCRVIWGRPKSL